MNAITNNFDGQKYVRKIIHFHGKCKEKHLLYFVTCDKHPYVGNPIAQKTGQKGICATNCSNEI